MRLNMIKSLISVLCVIICTLRSFASPITQKVARFDGHELWTIKVMNMKQLHVLAQFELAGVVDFWTELRRGDVDFRVDPERADQVKDMLIQEGLVPSVLVQNIQVLIEEQLRTRENIELDDELDDSLFMIQSSNENNNFNNPTRQIPIDAYIGKFFKNYRTLEEYETLLKKLQSEFPHLVTIFSIGDSYEGRPIYAATIRAPNVSLSAPELFMNGAHHAREWIGPAVTAYIGAHLALNYGKDQKITALLNKFIITFLPVLNVDGFVYSHENNRMWRKNRQANSSWCVGTDLNRNWDIEWRGGGSSSFPCSESYRGPSPFSAPETRHISTFIKSRKNLVSYIDFHSYSQLWMFPYGYSCSKVPHNLEQLYRVASPAAEATKAVHGTEFEVGPICQVIYQASGNSVDWSYTFANVSFPMAIELRDKGRRGFLLPPDQIIPSGEEMLVGVMTALKGIELELSF